MVGDVTMGNADLEGQYCCCCLGKMGFLLRERSILCLPNLGLRGNRLHRDWPQPKVAVWGINLRENSENLLETSKFPGYPCLIFFVKNHFLSSRYTSKRWTIFIGNLTENVWKKVHLFFTLKWKLGNSSKAKIWCVKFKNRCSSKINP